MAENSNGKQFGNILNNFFKEKIDFFSLHFPKEKLFKSISLKSYWEILKISWVIANFVSPVEPEK